MFWEKGIDMLKIPWLEGLLYAFPPIWVISITQQTLGANLNNYALPTENWASNFSNVQYKTVGSCPAAVISFTRLGSQVLQQIPSNNLEAKAKPLEPSGAKGPFSDGPSSPRA